MSDKKLFAQRALLPEGWAKNVLIETAAEGDISAVTTDAQPGDAQRGAGPVIPGMPNLHNHAFQRPMAGLTEQAGQTGTAAGDDSFGTCCTLMNHYVGRL